ncbi:MAG TPA: hypothetical protein DEG96_06900 [Candidatus Atribacteria bacterium]|nr:hypothetical protein [Candidatus Atribacteria bacterium]
MNRLPVFLKYQRIIKKLDLKDVSACANLSINYLKKIERGDRNIRDIYTLDKLAKGYGVKTITLVNIVLENKELNWLQKLRLKIRRKPNEKIK